ncbi:hypothetical protein [Pararhizobium sp. A13]|uniref:hypothetical protein n=1 Tax=Pararhizobium sp. A13 TaxID=3133975 RepID=UPI00311AD19B
MALRATRRLSFIPIRMRPSVLRLASRYQLAAVDLIFDQATKLQEMEMGGRDAEGRRRSLEGDARTEIVTLGESYWKSALLSALATSVRFYTGGYKNAL